VAGRVHGRGVHRHDGAKTIFITENGCAASDVVPDDCRVYHTDRVMFLRAQLGQLQRATSEGVPVTGSFLWSPQDNFEWGDGYGNRFGLICVDFDTRERKPKLSAECSGRPLARTPSCELGGEARRPPPQRSPRQR
jgi:beta-glucosidase/6-phospho-beta-glucosidase/beta-galactosidase